MASVLALLSAFGYGLGDFVAGMISRRVHYAIVAVVAGISAPIVTIVAVLITTPVVPSPNALFWGAASGVGTGLGSLALFRGLGRGRMGVVAPVSAITAAALPVILGVVLGDRPAILAWVGVALAFPAIWLVSSPEHDPEVVVGDRPMVATSVSDGLLAGAGFALLFVGLKLAGDGSGLWPVFINELAALPIMAVAAVAALPTIKRRRPASLDLAGAAAVGVIGAASSVAYFLATHSGLLSLVVVLTSLYPAVTVILAVVVAREPVGRRQAIGLVLVSVAIVLIVL